MEYNEVKIFSIIIGTKLALMLLNKGAKIAFIEAKI